MTDNVVSLDQARQQKAFLAAFEAFVGDYVAGRTPQDAPAMDRYVDGLLAAQGMAGDDALKLAFVSTIENVLKWALEVNKARGGQ